jgi:DNA-binding transcriptional LysR family regulator
VGFALYGAARGDLPVRPGDWVAYNPDLDHTPEMRHLAAMLGTGRVRLRSNSLRGLARAVADGIGHGILPASWPTPTRPWCAWAGRSPC